MSDENKVVKINLFKNGCFLLDIDRIGSESLPIYYSLSELIVCNDDIYIYLDNSKTLGFVIFDFKNENHIHIKSIAVDKNERRKGIATNLINFLQNKYNKISLYVQKGNTALEFYEKCGFQTIKIDKEYYQSLDEKCAYLMEYQKL